MIRLAKVTRMISNILAEIKSIGGTTQNRMVSLKGLYSKPKNENAIVLPLSRGNSQDVIFVLQKELDLDEGDVYVTDDKSYMHFHFNGESIELKTKDLIFNTESFKVKTKEIEFDTDKVKIKASNVDFEGGAIKHDGVSIDKTHTHIVPPAGNYPGGVSQAPKPG